MDRSTRLAAALIALAGIIAVPAGAHRDRVAAAPEARATGEAGGGNGGGAGGGGALALSIDAVLSGVASAAFSASMLELHNGERLSRGRAPLRWDGALEAAARRYAEQLAATGRFEHDASPERRATQGENLWRGTRGAFSATHGLEEMLAERNVFRPGVFPHISMTGRMKDAGHYTQIIWHETKSVGCAIARGAAHDVLVCRYAPRGNVTGVRIH